MSVSEGTPNWIRDQGRLDSDVNPKPNDNRQSYLILFGVIVVVQETFVPIYTQTRRRKRPFTVVREVTLIFSEKM